jgi:hypothetical protein
MKNIALLLVALVLAGCSSSTGVRGNLDDPATARARQVVRQECQGLPREWPVTNADLGMAEAEKLVRRDRTDSAQCASAALAFADHTEKRDKALSGRK